MTEKNLSSGGFRESLYTVDEAGNRRWVYSSLVKGAFYKYRVVVAWILILLYVLAPWLTINNKQAVYLDIFHRKFTIFGTVFWATDTFLLMLVLGGAAIALFFFTSLFGRVWCGWACPETVFLEFVFRPIERLIEGNVGQRQKLDQQPWNFTKLSKKILKHLINAVIAWVLASSCLAYFYGSENMLLMIKGSPMDHLQPFLLTILLMGVMAFQFGWFREQFCTVLCPYARFQSVLMDSNSLTVGYDFKRGEPRGKIAKGKDLKVSQLETKGDCIDCHLCVKVCPTGIDIRNGLQLECVACTSCIDACDSVMTKIGKPKGLIRYDTEHNLLGGHEKRVNLRSIIYGAILLVYLLVFVYSLATRELSEIKILRGARNVPYSMIGTTLVSNNLHVRISNKSEEPRLFTISLDDQKGVTLVTPISPIPVGPESISTAPIFINFDQSILVKGKKKIDVFIKDDKEFQSATEVTLLGPGE